jgi:hypothetical protein
MSRFRRYVLTGICCAMSLLGLSSTPLAAQVRGSICHSEAQMFPANAISHTQRAAQFSYFAGTIIDASAYDQNISGRVPFTLYTYYDPSFPGQIVETVQASNETGQVGIGNSGFMKSDTIC